MLQRPASRANVLCRPKWPTQNASRRLQGGSTSHTNVSEQEARGRRCERSWKATPWLRFARSIPRPPVNGLNGRLFCRVRVAPRCPRAVSPPFPPSCTLVNYLAIYSLCCCRVAPFRVVINITEGANVLAWYTRGRPSSEEKPFSTCFEVDGVS